MRSQAPPKFAAASFCPGEDYPEPAAPDALASSLDHGISSEIPIGAQPQAKIAAMSRDDLGRDQNRRFCEHG
jgi:hypothetical protein